MLASNLERFEAQQGETVGNVSPLNCNSPIIYLDAFFVSLFCVSFVRMCILQSWLCTMVLQIVVRCNNLFTRIYLYYFNV